MKEQESRAQAQGKKQSTEATPKDAGLMRQRLLINI